MPQTHGLNTSRPGHASWVAALSLAACMPAQAGRPLATEDAGTNPQAQCQLETWVDAESGGAHSTHLAPACGLMDGLELGLELIKTSPRDKQTQGRALALKWAPEWLTWQDWRWGVKASGISEQAPGESAWHQAHTAVLGIASLPITPQWTLHLNLGRQRNMLEQVSATTYGAALVWTPHERWVVFGEIGGDNKTPARQSAGLRYWLLPDQLGLDLTGCRTNATRDGHAWGIGLGWYGLHF
jgi:hypothetical protein